MPSEEDTVVFLLLHSKLFSLFALWPCFLGYCEEQGAVGGAGLEDDLNDLRLEEENEQPPLILETDWAAGSIDQGDSPGAATENVTHSGGGGAGSGGQGCF